MVKYKLKPLATAALSSALIVSSLSGFATTADAATKVQKAKDVKIKKGKLVKKSNGKVIKGYVSYKGVIYKDGKVFTGVLNKAYYKKGKKATGLYKSKYYKNGALGTGIYKNHYYKAGSLGTGTYKGKKYAKGKLFTGLSGKTYYKAGVLGTGNYKNKKYVKGKLFTGLSGKTYYKNGVLGTGSHEGHYYVKGKLATGEFGGILYEAGKPFTGEKDGIFYKDGKKDEDQTNVANFKKAETEVQKANDAFKKAKEQKDALDALAKKAGVSTQANLQTKNAADIDAFLAKYKDVDVSKLEGAELTEFKSALASNLTLATENLKTASTNVTNAVNTFVAAASVIASTTDDALLAHIKTAVATATTVVASLKAAGYDTVQLENVLSKLPGGTTGGGNNNGGGSTGGGSNNGGGSNTGGGNNGGGNGGGTVTEKPEEVAKKEFEAATKALKEKQDAFKEATEQQTSLKKIKDKLDDAQSKTPIKEQPVLKGKSAKLSESDAVIEKDPINAFIDKYEGFNFSKLTTEQLNAIIAEHDAVQIQVTTKLNTAAKDLVTAVSAINKAVEKLTPFATPEQQAEISTALQTSLEAVKAVEEAKVELEGLQNLQNQLKKQAIENAVKVAIKALETDPTQAKIEAAQAAVKALLALDKDYDVEAFNSAIAEAQKLVDDAKADAVAKAVETVKAAIKALETDPTQEKIDAAKAAVEALLALEKDYDVKAFNSAIAEAQKLVDDAKAEKENIEKATNAVNALFSDENKTVLADSVVQNTIDEAKKLVEALKDSVVKNELEGKITSASTQLEEALKGLKAGLSIEGQIVVDGADKQMDDLFTFQMAGIALVGGNTVTAFDKSNNPTNLKEATTLTTAQMNEGIRLTLERINAAKPVTLNEKDPSLNIVPSQKHGYTVFTVNANNFSKEIFDKLDGNKNNAYLITVNNKVTEGESTKAYKILFQVIDGEVKAKFVEKTVNDDQFSIDAATETVNALFSGDNKLSLDVDEAKISAAKILVEKIKDSQKLNELLSKLETASKLLVEKEIAELQKGIQKDGSLAVKGSYTTIDDLFTFQMVGIALVGGNTVTAFAKSNNPTNLKEATTLTTAQMNEGILATLKRITAAKPVTLENEVPSLVIKSSQKHGYTVFTVDALNFSKENFDKLDGPQTGDNYYDNRYNITVNPKSPSTEAPFILKLSSDDKGTVNATFEAKRVKTK